MLFSVRENTIVRTEMIISSVCHMSYQKYFIIFNGTVMEKRSNVSWVQVMQDVDKQSKKDDCNSCDKYQVKAPSKLRIKEYGAVLGCPITVGYGPGKHQLRFIECDETKTKTSDDHAAPKNDHQVGSIRNVKDEDKNI